MMVKQWGDRRLCDTKCHGSCLMSRDPIATRRSRCANELFFSRTMKMVARPSVFVLLLVSMLMAILSQSAMAASHSEIIVDVLMGEPVPFEALLDDLATVRVIYLGEFHTIARHHEQQAELLKALADKDVKLAMGMEMFSVEQQPLLDRWQRGSDDVDALITALGPGHWTNLKAYAAVLLGARERGIPIIGLNASDRLVRNLARNGLEGLTPEEKKNVPEGLSNINPLNDRLLRLKLRVHKAFQDKTLDRIVLAQALRDATMAQAAARFLQSPEGKDRVMLVIAGGGHVNYGFGIPDRLKRIMDVPSRIVLQGESGELVLSEAEKKQSMPIDITHQDLTFIRVPIADYLFVVPLKEPREEGSPPVMESRALLKE